METALLDDFKILGVEEGASMQEVHRAYIRRAKLLHPDLADYDPEKCHLAMIRINRAYERLKRMHGINPAPAVPASPPPHPEQKHHGLLPHGDPAYVYYRRGYELYREVHPSKWVFMKRRKVTLSGTAEWRARMLIGVKEAFRKLPGAYYYYSIVANEYPESPWAPDAREKMAWVERQTDRYRKILAYYESRCARQRVC